MYSDFFGLRCLPFEDRADTQFYHPTSEVEETLASLEYEAHFGNGLALVLGEAGTGKTLLIRTFLSRLSKTDDVIVLTCPPGGGLDLIREVSKGFGVTLPTSQNQARRLSRLRRHLAKVAGNERRAVLVIDQSENLSSGNLGQVAALADLEGERGRLLRIVLVAQPQIRAQLDRPELARIRQQLFGDRTVTPLMAEQTRAYVLHRLRVAGVANRELFDEGALQQIHEISEGFPRLINRVCNAALLAAYGAGATVVTRSIVAEAAGQQALRERTTSAGELGLSSNPSASAPWTQRYFESSDGAILGEPAARRTDRGDDRSTSPSGDAADFESASDIDVTPYVPEPAESGDWRSADSEFAPSTGSGHAVAQRLEHSVAKAERLAATTEASLAQVTAVERHLATLLDRAEALSCGMGPAVQRGVEAFEQAQQRLTDVVQRTDQKTSSLQSQFLRLTEATQRMQETLLRAERASASASDIESRLSQTAERFADQADEVQNRFSRLMEGLENAAQSQRDAQRLIEQGEQVRASLGRQVEDSRAAVTEQTTAWGREVQRELGTFREALRGQERETEALFQKAVDLAAAKTTEIQKVVVDAVHAAEVGAARITETVLGDLQAAALAIADTSSRTVRESQIKLQATTETAAGMSDKLHRLAQDALREAHASVKRIAAEAVEDAQCKLDAILKQAATARTDADARVTALTEKLHSAVTEAERFESRFIDTTLGQAQSQWREIVQTATTDLNLIRAQIDEATTRKDETVSAITRVVGDARRLDDRISGFGATLTEQERTLVSLSTRAAGLEGWTDTLDRAESAIAELRSGQAQMEDIRTGVAAACVDANSVGEQVATARDHLRAIERIAADTKADRATAQEMTQSLRAATEGATVILDRLDQAYQEATARHQELCHEAAEARSLGSEIRTVVDTAGAVTERTAETVHKAREEARLAREQAEKLMAARARAEATSSALESLAKSSDRHLDALSGMVAHADEKINKLGSHLASAGSFVDRLSATSASASQSITELDRAQESAARSTADAQARIGNLLEDLWSLTTRTEALSKELTSRCTTAQEQHQLLIAITKSADEVGGTLSSTATEARQAIQAIGEKREETGRMAARLNGLAETLAKASGIQTSLSQTVARAEGLGERLHSLCADGTSKYEALRLATETAQAVSEGVQQARDEAASSVQRLEGVVSTCKENVAHTETTASAAGARIDELRHEVEEITVAVATLTDELSAVTTRPTEVLESVQAQTQQLEQVCAAVRKVFASLSQATLEARREAEELKKSGREAGERWSELSVQTTRAGQTLREWAEEAAHAQARLERLLAECPPLQRTHPTDSVRGVAQVLERLTAGATAPDAPFEEPSTMPSRINADRADLPRRGSRSEEIARLIAEAKHAEAQGATARL